jgi:hypothetical protein
MMKRIIMVGLALCLLGGMAQAKDDLAKNFATPPDSARIWVYWFWLNGNITSGGITADLEAMKRAGVGGVLIMEVDQGAPVGPVVFMSEKWRELFKHMVSEAHRLGIEVNMNNDAGWNGSGGPWVPLDKAMQVIVTSEKQVPGGKRFEGELPKPQAREGFYRDIAVLAFQTPMDPTNLSYQVKNLKAKGMFWERMHSRSLDASMGPEIPAESIIAKDGIMDLTALMDTNGKLSWNAPHLQGSASGEWTIIRFGHTFTGAKSHPAPATGAGPECDKLSREGIEANYNGMIGKLVKDVGSLAGTTFAATHVDSWEVGAQNWTPKMREEFKRLRGYDMMPFMPVMTGRIVDSLEISERFLRDVRQTVSDLLAVNYIGHLRKLANRDGLRLSMEAYTTPANDLDVANYVEEPICEFWWPDNGGFPWSVKSMASVAHVNGRPIVGAESFTSDDGERWRAHPASIKALGDRAFCDGVNRFIVHRYAMQPWVEDRRPGMTMGPWGLHYERSTTWWEDSKAWHQYVARCQYMLRQGTFVADVLRLQSEEPMERFKTMELPGYDYDGISPQAFLKNVTVRRGIVKLPSGMKYRLLVLPEGDSMTPQMLDRIEDLVEDGAIVVGKPPAKSPSLTDYPKCDEEVKETVKELWGSCTPEQSGDRKVGKGRVVWGKSVPEVLTGMGVKPDFTASQPMRYIHRILDGADVYFVANPAPCAIETLASFRVQGKQPEFWRPDTGQITPAVSFAEKNGVTTLSLQLEPSGSIFVVFRKPSAGIDPIENITRDGQAVFTAANPGANIVVTKALYGVLDDPSRTRDVRTKVQVLVDAGTISFPVSRMADGDDPAFKIVKTLVLEYTVNGQSFKSSGLDTDTIDIITAPVSVIDIARREISQSGNYVISTAGGKQSNLTVKLPEPQTIDGPWSVAFDPRLGGPASATFERLEDWSKHPDNGIKYYSGSATYRKDFDLQQPVPGVANSKLYLDLGRIGIMADVVLNGKSLGTLWKPPYRVDITDAVKSDNNVLEIRVVNLMINRMIGDEFLPEDSERNDDGTLKKWPQWLEDGKQSPSGRFTFTSWRLWKKDEPLQESGLLGPVTIRMVELISVK